MYPDLKIFYKCFLDDYRYINTDLFIFKYYQEGLLMFNNKKFSKFLDLFLVLITYFSNLFSSPASPPVQAHIDRLLPQVVQMRASVASYLGHLRAQPDSLLKRASILSAAAATFLGAKALENFLQDQCTGQCGAYVGGAAFAAVVSASAIARFVYPEDFPTRNQIINALRDGVRAIINAKVATR